MDELFKNLPVATFVLLAFFMLLGGYQATHYSKREYKDRWIFYQNFLIKITASIFTSIIALAYLEDVFLFSIVFIALSINIISQEKIVLTSSTLSKHYSFLFFKKLKATKFKI